MELKSVELMAAVAASARTAAKHQSLLHIVGQASWSDEALMAKVREHVLPVIERHVSLQEEGAKVKIVGAVMGGGDGKHTHMLNRAASGSLIAPADRFSVERRSHATHRF